MPIPMVCISNVTRLILGDSLLVFYLGVTEWLLQHLSPTSSCTGTQKCKWAEETTWQNTKSQTMLMSCTSFDVLNLLGSLLYLGFTVEVECNYSEHTAVPTRELLVRKQLGKYWTFGSSWLKSANLLRKKLGVGSRRWEGRQCVCS